MPHLKSHFGSARRQNMSSQGQASPWNIAFSISPNSLFVAARIQKMASWPLEAKLTRPSPSRVLGQPEDRTWVRRARRHFECLLSLLAQVAFWATQKAENQCVVMNEPFSHRFLNLAQDAFGSGQKGRKCVRRSRCPLENHFLHYAKVFWASQKSENESTRRVDPWSIPSSTSHKLHFVAASIQEMTSQVQSTLWTNGFLTSSKAHFGLARR